MNNTATRISPNTNMYWSMLKSLDDTTKIELINRLHSSLLTHDEPVEKAENWVEQLAGKWVDSRTAEEIIADIRDARTPNREIEL